MSNNNGENIAKDTKVILVKRHTKMFFLNNHPENQTVFKALPLAGRGIMIHKFKKKLACGTKETFSFLLLKNG